MANPPQQPLSQRQIFSFRPPGLELQLQQKMMMTSPVSNSPEETRANAVPKDSKLSREAYEALEEHLFDEDPSKPYRNSEVIAYMREKGYKVSQSDVKVVRSLLSL